jgi:hypothetical protein
MRQTWVAKREGGREGRRGEVGTGACFVVEGPPWTRQPPGVQTQLEHQGPTNWPGIRPPFNWEPVQFRITAGTWFSYHGRLITFRYRLPTDRVTRFPGLEPGLGCPYLPTYAPYRPHQASSPNPPQASPPASPGFTALHCWLMHGSLGLRHPTWSLAYKLGKTPKKRYHSCGGELH